MREFVAFCIFAAEFVGVFMLIKWLKRPRRPYADTAPLAEPVRELSVLMQHLADLDTMLLDVKSCKAGELHRAFSFRWMSGGNTNKELSILTDGKNGSSTALIIAAEDERERTNKAIIAKVYEISEQLYQLQQDAAPDRVQVLTPDTQTERQPTASEIRESYTKLQERYGSILKKSPTKARTLWKPLRH